MTRASKRDRRRKMTPQACPKCSSDQVVAIVYGMPTPEAFKAAERGAIALGGCVVSGHDPQWRCRRCGHEWLG
jgi:hypothetical protein